MSIFGLGDIKKIAVGVWSPACAILGGISNMNSLDSLIVALVFDA